MEKRKAQKQERPKQKQDAFHYLKFAIMVLFIAMVALLAVFGYRFGEALFSDEAVSEPGKGVEYTLQVEPRESDRNGPQRARDHPLCRGILHPVQAVQPEDRPRHLQGQFGSVLQSDTPYAEPEVRGKPAKAIEKTQRPQGSFLPAGY